MFMDHYIDVAILPDPEFRGTTLMNALFSKLHFELAREGRGEVGISFPHVDNDLGNKLRLHGSREALQRLALNRCFPGLKDYVHVSPLLPIPEGISVFRVVRRVQTKSNIERLRRRSIAKGWLSVEEAQRQITYDKARYLKLPYLQLKSSSTGQPFRLFIEHGEKLDQPFSGKFSAYGFSQTATIPWF